MADMWTTIADERGALAEDLSGLSEHEWAARSLCANWSVQDVLAHMTSTAQMSAPKFLVGFVGSGFNFSKFSAKGIAKHRGSSSAETLERFRAQQHSTTSPPGPKPSWLGETIVHAEDIRRALGMRHDYATDAAVRVADFYKGSNLVLGAKKRIAGLALRATDASWTNGTGPEVAGPIVSLVLAMAGRKAALADLTGDGVTTLSSR
jgi:uncharacterized protein (TIGR03083 family)